MATYDNTLDVLREMDNNDLAKIYNDINQYDGSFEECIFYDWEMLCEQFDYNRKGATELIYAMRNGVCDVNDDYFVFDGLGGIDSCSSWDMELTLEVNIDDLATWLVVTCEENEKAINNLDNLTKELVDAIKLDINTEDDE